MPGRFERAREPSYCKPDKKGKVYIKIILQDEKLQKGFPVPGSLKKEIFIENSSVGEVYDAINEALFSNEQENSSEQDH